MSAPSSVKIAVIGSGVIGRTLAARFAEAGHAVTFGARDPQQPDLLAEAGRTGARVADIPAAIDASEAVLWAIPGAAMAEAIAEHGAGLDGKIVIDATNAVGAPELNSLGVIRLHAPRARVYRAFNTVGWENFADPRYGEVVGDLLYCGPADASATVETLIAATGLRPVRVGDDDQVAIVDNLASLWFALAFGQGLGRGLGFKILTR